MTCKNALSLSLSFSLSHFSLSLSLSLLKFISINFLSRNNYVGFFQTQFYRHIAQDRATIVGDIASFFNEQLKNRFASPEFVFDVARFGKDRIKLVDFNPFGPTTDPILFSWQELEVLDLELADVQFR